MKLIPEASVMFTNIPGPAGGVVGGVVTGGGVPTLTGGFAGPFPELPPQPAAATAHPTTANFLKGAVIDQTSPADGPGRDTASAGRRTPRLAGSVSYLNYFKYLYWTSGGRSREHSVLTCGWMAQESAEQNMQRPAAAQNATPGRSNPTKAVRTGKTRRRSRSRRTPASP